MRANAMASVAHPHASLKVAPTTTAKAGATLGMESTSSCRRFTSAEWRRIVEAGVFPEDERLELIDGIVLSMAPIGTKHAYCVAMIVRLLTKALDDRHLVWSQSPIALADGQQPQPDVAILLPRNTPFGAELPTASDVGLAIEVADASLRHDREVKAPLYAAAGIRELWIVDLNSGVVESLGEPVAGRYAKREFHGRDDVIAVASVSGLRVAVRDIIL